MRRTVKEVIEWLSEQDENAIVVVANPFQRYQEIELIDTGKDGYKFDNIVIIKGER